MLSLGGLIHLVFQMRDLSSLSPRPISPPFLYLKFISVLLIQAALTFQCFLSCSSLFPDSLLPLTRTYSFIIQEPVQMLSLGWEVSSFPKAELFGLPPTFQSPSWKPLSWLFSFVWGLSSLLKCKCLRDRNHFFLIFVFPILWKCLTPWKKLYRYYPVTNISIPNIIPNTLMPCLKKLI